MRISDWSSDVCSSDLRSTGHQQLGLQQSRALQFRWRRLVQSRREIRKAKIRPTRQGATQPQSRWWLGRDAAASFHGGVDSGGERYQYVFHSHHRQWHAALSDSRSRPGTACRTRDYRQHRSAAVDWSETAKQTPRCRARPGAHHRLRHLYRHLDAVVLVAVTVACAVWQLGLGDHRVGGADQGGVFQALRKTVPVDGQDAQAAAAYRSAQGALWRRQTEVPEGDA